MARHLSGHQFLHEPAGRLDAATRRRARRNGTSCNSLAALAALTMAGLGVSLMPLETSERDIREGRLRVVPMRPPHVEIGFTAVCATPHPSPALEALMDLVVDASTFQR